MSAPTPPRSAPISAPTPPPSSDCAAALLAAIEAPLKPRGAATKPPAHTAASTSREVVEFNRFRIILPFPCCCAARGGRLQRNGLLGRSVPLRLPLGRRGNGASGFDATCKRKWRGRGPAICSRCQAGDAGRLPAYCGAPSPMRPSAAVEDSPLSSPRSEEHTSALPSL